MQCPKLPKNATLIMAEISIAFIALLLNEDGYVYLYM
jgi:hypothetical protein